MADANDLPPTPPSSHRDTDPRTVSRGRLRLAVRRSRGFIVRWSVAVGVLVVVALLAPLGKGDAGGAASSRIAALEADTLRSAERLKAAQSAVVAAESLLLAAREEAREAPPAPPLPVRVDDPAAAALAERIGTARRTRAIEDYLAITTHQAVSAGPRMRALADSLRGLAGQRGAPGVESVLLEQAIDRVARTIVAIADTRRSELAARGSVTTVPPAMPTPTASASPDTAELSAALQSARGGLATARRDHDSLTRALASAERAGGAASARTLAWLPALAMLVLLVFGAGARFLHAYRAEVAAPTLADADEAERLSGLRVLTVVRETPPTGPARFQPSGVDPFRMLYLSLTASGTRARTTIVTGGDADVAATVGARLAIAAAADHRNTLVIDLDPTRIALSRAFRERAEPGLRDVLAGAFAWREVARPVGSSDGLPITLLPAGTERDDLATGEALRRNTDDFTRLRAAHEFAIAVVGGTAVGEAAALLPSSPVVLVAVVGETSLSEFLRAVHALREGGHRIHGLVLWDTPKPALPTRAELVAELSRRKGRTPGGSFEAVRRVIRDGNKDSKKT